MASTGINNKSLFTNEEWDGAKAALDEMKLTDSDKRKTVKAFVDDHSALIMELREKGHKPKSIATKINETTGNKFNHASLVSLIYTVDHNKDKKTA